MRLSANVHDVQYNWVSAFGPLSSEEQWAASGKDLHGCFWWTFNISGIHVSD